MSDRTESMAAELERQNAILKRCAETQEDIYRTGTEIIVICGVAFVALVLFGVAELAFMLGAMLGA